MTRHFKAVASDPQPATAGAGIISFYPSVFMNRDLAGDVVVPGAFSDWLKDAKANDIRVPCTWAHDWDNAEQALLGYCAASDIVEDNVGLRFGRTVLDMQNPTAQLVYRAVQNKVHLEGSFGYDVQQEKHDAQTDANYLLALSVIEGCLCIKGVNPLAGQAQVLDDDGTKSRRKSRTLASIDADLRAVAIRDIDRFIAEAS